MFRLCPNGGQLVGSYTVSMHQWLATEVFMLRPTPPPSCNRMTSPYSFCIQGMELLSNTTLQAMQQEVISMVNLGIHTIQFYIS